MKNENVVEDAGRVYQTVRRYVEVLLWNDSRNADTFAWLVTGLLQSQKSTLPEWITYRQSDARFALSRERQARRWSGNPKIDPVGIYYFFVGRYPDTQQGKETLMNSEERFAPSDKLLALIPSGEGTHVLAFGSAL